MTAKTVSIDRASTAQNNATPDPHTGATRVYGGDCGLIHIPDGGRADVGQMMGERLDALMRGVATREAYRRGDMDNITGDKLDTDSLCPGCYMTVGYNMLVSLARKNGQSMEELAETMIHEFTKLLGDYNRPLIEHVEVQR